jgi:hypothetical protein
MAEDQIEPGYQPVRSDIGIDDIDFCEDYKYGECCDCVDCLTRQGVF